MFWEVAGIQYQISPCWEPCHQFHDSCNNTASGLKTEHLAVDFIFYFVKNKDDLSKCYQYIYTPTSQFIRYTC